ncbi:MAG: hypothetical protein JO015_02370 [Verrucomicrobia bacterium]|nr:hypothetical protein [Verrucomicrobiota bacterium]
MLHFRKIPSHEEFYGRLKAGRLDFPPLKFRLVAGEAGDANTRIDAVVQAEWGTQRASFALEYKAVFTPKVLREAIATAKAYVATTDLKPLVVVPFLSEERLKELEQEAVSGIDLCGNGFVVVPHQFAVYRSGAPNRFPSSAPIKNIYQKNSSIVCRVFLAKPRYGAVTAILTEIERRSSPKQPTIGLATVSKVLKGLEDDLIVSRPDREILLVQPDKLLEKLAANFIEAKQWPSFRAKVHAEGDLLLSLLLRSSGELNVPIAATGKASVSQYAVMQRGPVLSTYCPAPEALLERLSANPTDRFPNLELIQTNEPFLYFDARTEQGFPWASPIQVYLELMAGDKRDRETAEQVRDFILNALRAQG